jgi:hypothetical protein
MKTIIAALILFGGISCSNKYVLDKNPEVKISKAYYKKWASGVRGGGSGVIIFIEVKKEYNLEKEKIKLLHVYFDGGDSTLKKQSARLYQGYIAATKSTIDVELEAPSKEVEKQNLKQDKLSFNLAKNEAVICFVKNGKKRYQKINVNKQRLTNIPM